MRLPTQKTAKTASKLQLQTFRGKWHNHHYIRDDYAFAGHRTTKTIHLEIRRSGCFKAHYCCRLPHPLRTPGGHQKSPAFGQITQLTSRGEVVECESHTIKTIAGSSPYHQLLQRFPEITLPNGTAQVANHATKHHSWTAGRAKAATTRTRQTSRPQKRI